MIYLIIPQLGWLVVHAAAAEQHLSAAAQSSQLLAAAAVDHVTMHPLISVSDNTDTY